LAHATPASQQLVRAKCEPLLGVLLLIQTVVDVAEAAANSLLAALRIARSVINADLALAVGVLQRTNRSEIAVPILRNHSSHFLDGLAARLAQQIRKLTTTLAAALTWPARGLVLADTAAPTGRRWFCGRVRRRRRDDGLRRRALLPSVARVLLPSPAEKHWKGSSRALVLAADASCRCHWRRNAAALN
jgi:hypothetical protein